jgi:hypothetical protein
VAVSHAKQDPRGNFTGTLTVFNSQGSTTAISATDIVQPVDWNSGHQQYFTISGNTGGDSSAATATNIVTAGNPGAVVALSTAAGKATQWFSRVEPANVNMSEYEPHNLGGLITNSSLGQNSLYFVPFYVRKGMYASRVNFFMSMNYVVSANSATKSAGYTLSAAIYSRRVDSQDKLSSLWSGSAAITGNFSSNTRISITNLVGISNSTAVSYANYTTNATNATTYMLNSVAGYRVWAIPINSSFTPGRYWMAIAASTTGYSNSARMNIRGSIGMHTLGNVANIAYMPVGVTSQASNNNSAANNTAQLGPWLGAGTYSATSGGFPAEVVLDHDTIRAGLTLTLPYFNFSGYDTQSSKL